ncbi:MAG: SDR family oxidoreductase [Eubacterium sp.]|nr:SDR family oxidoreductase [Eubacterium sp.]
MEKKIFISGASHGIGKETAVRFLEADYKVYGCGSNREDPCGIEMAKQYNNFHFMYADISNPAEVERLFEWCGAPDAAFNNAGIGCAPKALHEMDPETAQRILSVNLFGTALCMKQECALMLQHTGGVILNNSSVAAYKSGTGADAVYSASKAGILRLTAEAAIHRAYRNKIKFFSIVPGWVETRMTAADDKETWRNLLPSGCPTTRRQVAELVYTIVSNAQQFESGQEFQINGGGILL